MPDKVWLGIDLGTSGCRLIAIDDSNQIVHQTQSSFKSNQPYPVPPEQWQCVVELLRQCVAALAGFDINAIAVDATSGSVMLCDVDGQPLTEMLLYNDTCAHLQSQQLKDIAPADSGAHGSGSGLAKLLYLQQHHDLPENYYLTHQADWISSQLTGKTGMTDYNNALKSGFDPQLMQWPDWLTALIPEKHLPNVVAPGTVIGEMPLALMRDLNLQQTTSPKIVAGTTDSLAAFIATGAHQIGDGVTSLGSTLVLKLISNNAVFAPEFGIYSHKLGDHWLIGGASNSGGAVIRQFFSDSQIVALTEQINLSQSPPDYYPLPTIGERFPVADPNKSPQLTPRPASDSLFLHGLLNAIANIEQQAYAKLQQLCGTTLKSVRSVGGGAMNPVWTQIRQQKLTVPFLPVFNTEAAYGTALLAKEGLQIFDEDNHG
ncbi:MAG: FGGY-family carbohydrate kinase [Methylophaga sp.]|nr:FGGY-family carbohydrate kinase [Methylophaga sp.]